MIVIPVNNGYRLELDAYSWAISWYKPRKDTGKQWERFSWHRTLSDAAGKPGEMLVCESESIGTAEVITAILRTTARIEQAIAKAGLPDLWDDAQRVYEDSRGAK